MPLREKVAPTSVQDRLALAQRFDFMRQWDETEAHSDVNSTWFIDNYGIYLGNPDPLCLARLTTCGSKLAAKLLLDRRFLP